MAPNVSHYITNVPLNGALTADRLQVLFCDAGLVSKNSHLADALTLYSNAMQFGVATFLTDEVFEKLTGPEEFDRLIEQIMELLVPIAARGATQTANQTTVTNSSQ